MSAEPDQMTEYDHFADARGHESNGEFDEAFKAYDEALKISPEFTKAHYYKALLHYKLKQSDKALESAKIVLEQNPSWEKHIKKFMPDLAI
ncbi:MAG: tetratricopeptide repeat protein [Candidatus Thorarchaeota archaeon]